MKFKNFELGDVDTTEEECEHKPDWKTARVVDDIWVVEITCSICGAAGAVYVDPEDIRW